MIIAIPMVTNYVSDVRKAALDEQIKRFEQATNLYVSDNLDDIVFTSNIAEVTLETLVTNGYLDAPIKNPVTRQDFLLPSTSIFVEKVVGGKIKITYEGNFTDSITTTKLGTTQNSTHGSMPFNVAHHDQRIQYIIPAASLNTLGITNGKKITEIGFYSLKDDIYTLNSFNIRLKTTTATTLAAFDYTGVTVYLGKISGFSAGWNTIDITDFTYTGDNLMIYISRDNSTSKPGDLGGNRIVTGVGVGSTLYRYYYTPNSGVSDSMTSTILDTKFKIE